MMVEFIGDPDRPRFTLDVPEPLSPTYKVPERISLAIVPVKSVQPEPLVMPWRLFRLQYRIATGHFGTRVAGCFGYCYGPPRYVFEDWRR